MTDVAMDRCFPFVPEIEGGQAGWGQEDVGLRNWQRMAWLWQHSGVVNNFPPGLQGLWPVNWDHGAQTIQVAPGAVFIRGFYGEVKGYKSMACPGNDGLMVARLQPNEQAIFVVWRQGAREGDLIEDWSLPFGWWETPLWELHGDGSWIDRRRQVSADVLVGMSEVPGWVSRGGRYDTGPVPPTQGNYNHQGQVANVFLDWLPTWSPGHLVRVSANARAQPGPAWNNQQLMLRAVDGGNNSIGDGLLKADRMVIGFNNWSGAQWGYGELYLAGYNCAVTLQVWGGTLDGQLTVPANQCSLRLEDLGRP